METVKMIGVVGAGQMGSGIAQLAAVHGFDVFLLDSDVDALARATRSISASVHRLVSRRHLSQSAGNDALKRLKCTSNLEDFRSADVVIEAIAESEDVKKKLFVSLDKITKDSAILASNTSSISITRLASATNRPKQVIGMHFMNPPPVMKLVEIVRGADTSDETFEITKALAERFGKTVICSQDYAGFIVNRILMPMINEAFHTLYTGVATKDSYEFIYQLNSIGSLEHASQLNLQVNCLIHCFQKKKKMVKIMQVNLTSIQTSSEGAWQGDNPLNYAFPLLIVQTILVLVVSRLLAFLLRPFRQPKVVAEILGGILLGPSALGRNKYFLQSVFPSWSTPVLESVASIGLLFFLFLVGLELDLSSIRKSGKRAFSIAFAGISLPFAFAAGVTFVLRQVKGIESTRAGYGQTLVFMGVSLSITAFPVLARILAELKLLTTQVGETAMAAAAFNDVVAWVLLALAIAVSGHDGPGSAHKSPLTPFWVLASGVAFVGFMITLVRPTMGRVARKCLPEHEIAGEAYIGLTLAGVMLSGFMTDLIGIHAIFGSFVFGLMIPKEGEFAGRLIKRIEDFVLTLLLPLYFASSGLKTDVAKISGAGAWGVLALVIATACTGKILGSFVAAMMCMIPARESLTLGLLMNTKGLVELIVLNIGREKKVLNDEMFAILVLMAIFTTFMTTPAVMVIYKPNQFRSLHPDLRESKEEGSVRIVTCVHGPGNVSSMISLVELMRGAKRCSLKLYGVHLVELITERSSSIVMVHRMRRNGRPFVKGLGKGKTRDQVAIAFESYSKGIQPGVEVRPTTAISDLPTMHEDICHVAKDKMASMVILPFHRQWRGKGGEEEEMEDLGHGWKMVNQRVLQEAPCSVAVLVDRGFGGCSEEGTECDPTKRVGVLFFGGPNDRLALELSEKILESSMARVTVIHFIQRDGTENNTIVTEDKEQEEDEVAIKEFNNRRSMSTKYMQKIAENVHEEVMEIGRSGAYDLIIVGKDLASYTGNVDPQSECPELGIVGGILASSIHEIRSTILVVQHHDHDRKDKAHPSNMV